MYFYLFNLTRAHIVASLLCFVLSKLFFLIAMILPWKILAVVSGAGAGYFNYLNIFDSLDVKTQVAYLGGIVVLFFILHLFLDSYFDYLVGKGADRAIDKNNKIGLFNNYRAFAKRIYTHVAIFLAAFLYSVLVLILLGFIYPSLILSFLIYSFTSLLVFIAIVRGFNVTAHVFSKWKSSVYKIWWHLGFVFSLVWAVSDYLQGTMPSFLIAFVSLLLSRQVFVMMTVMISSGHYIYESRVKAGQVFSPNPNREYQVQAKLNVDFENLLLDIKQQSWVAEIYEEFSAVKLVESVAICHLVEAGNVAYITVVPKDSAKDGVLLKVFNKNREALAEQELILLKSLGAAWPFMELLVAKKENDFFVTVCRWPAGSQWLQETERVNISRKLRCQMLSCVLDEDAIEFYQRSQVGLYDRLQNVTWNHLQYYSGARAEKIQWDELPAHLQEILTCVADLPSQLCLRSIGGRMTFGTTEHPKIANLTRWAWEPLGSGWPLNRLKQLDTALPEVGALRSELEGVDPDKVKLVARLYEFERRYRDKNYSGAVNILINLLAHYQEMKSAHQQAKVELQA